MEQRPRDARPREERQLGLSVALLLVGLRRLARAVEEERAEGDEAAEDDDETVTLPATRNCLNLVLCNEGVMRFTKYISATAPGSRWDIMNEYEITPDDDEEDGDNKD